jgi:competence protein ComEC
MAVVQLAGMTVVACDICRLPAGLAAMAAHWASAGIVRSAGWVDLAPALAPRVPPPGAAIVAGYYAALAVAVWGRGRVRTAGAATCAVVALSIGASSRLSFGAEPKKTELVRLTVFDVGQGDSMLLEAGDEAPLLIDTGGAPFGSPFDIGTRVLVPAIWARGVRRVSTMVVTHADPDHIGGAPGILAAMPVGAVWLGILVPGHPPTEALVAAFERRKRFVTAVRAGDSVTHGGVRLRVLNPPAPDWERRRVRNDDSIVVEAVAGDVATLFTGDIGADVEQTIAPRLTPARIRVLKVAHHGSRTSTGAALLDAWRPQVAVISAGRGNSFGHPAADVLDRLVGVGATVLRTDRDGEITIETDGRRLTWRTYTGKAGAIH